VLVPVLPVQPFQLVQLVVDGMQMVDPTCKLLQLTPFASITLTALLQPFVKAQHVSPGCMVLDQPLQAPTQAPLFHWPMHLSTKHKNIIILIILDLKK
jgi:hypothetical protein